MVFAVTETLTRVTVGHSFASGPANPTLTPVRLGWLAAIIFGLAYQVLELGAANARVDSGRRLGAIGDGLRDRPGTGDLIATLSEIQQEQTEILERLKALAARLEEDLLKDLVT
jgi:hypothetical protein